MDNVPASGKPSGKLPRYFQAERGIVVLDRAICELSPRRKQLMRLRYEDQLKDAEIRQILGCSVAHIHTLLRETKAWLRAQLGFELD